MCLAAISLAPDTERPLTIVSNRDEFHLRPTAALHWWNASAGPIAAGRDLREGGTWMGINRSLRWGLLLNRPAEGEAQCSRGELVPNWLDSQQSAEEFLMRLQQQRHRYRPFNLVIGREADEACCLSAPSGEIYRYGRGIHGFSNCEPGEARPRVEALCASFEQTLEQDAGDAQLLGLLSPAGGAPAVTAPADFERNIFICSPNYGTGRSTVVRVQANGAVNVLEQQWSPDGTAGDQVGLDFCCKPVRASSVPISS